MRKTILTCDRCKKDVEELIPVGAGKRDYHYSSYGRDMESVWQVSAEWCLPCCIELGFAQANPKIPAEKTPDPNLEDLIREIVREEISNQ